MSKRTPILTKRKLILAAVGLLICLLAALAIAGAWPFATASSEPVETRHVVWQGDVTLLEGGLYALDVLPVVPLGKCAACLSLSSPKVGYVQLNAPNGIQGWPYKGAPSYEDCVILRNKQTLDYVALGTAHTTLEGVARHGWICATGSGDDGLIRMQFNGREGGRDYFSIRSWGRPAEG